MLSSASSKPTKAKQIATVFAAENLEIRSGRVVASGTLMVTDDELVFGSARRDIHWPFTGIRAYGCTPRNNFALEAGRDCPHGEGRYFFRTEFAKEIEEETMKRMEKKKAEMASSSPGETSPPEGTAGLHYVKVEFLKPDPPAGPEKKKRKVVRVRRTVGDSVSTTTTLASWVVIVLDEDSLFSGHPSALSPYHAGHKSIKTFNEKTGVLEK